MFLFAIFLPLISFFICVFFNNYTKSSHLNLISCFLLILSTIASLFSIISFQSNGPNTYVLGNWIVSGSLNVDWSIQMNLLSSSMVLMVNFVSTLIHIYSVGYMNNDSRKIIFMGYLGLFTFFMLFLVSSSNLVQLFLGWEGVGLTSYLLIGFWSYKASANNAALKAFVVNRVGDFGLLIALFTLFIVFGTLNVNEIMILLNSHFDSNFSFLGFDIHAITIITILLFIGCMGKSAQFGLHVWLPDAMEGPTPVSALIHAATMVTAGVFLLILVSPLLEASGLTRNLILIIGSLTCIFASSVAIFQNDIKRIIAYSTCSQLGYMFMSIGVSAYSIAYFHLLSHAFFKALLFLGAGSVIHSMSDEQNIKKMGGLYSKIPVTYICMLIGSCSLIGLPFFSGYYSKDLILEFIYLGETTFNSYVFFIGILGVFFTTIYSTRLIIHVFHGKNLSDEKVFAHIHESSAIMIVPLVILAVFAIFYGMISHHYFLDKNYLNMWSQIIFVNKELNENYVLENIPTLFRKLPLLVISLGLVMCFCLYFAFRKFPSYLRSRFSIFCSFFTNKWFIDEIYKVLLIKPILYLGKGFWKSIDIDLIDNLGPNGITRVVRSSGLWVSRLQSGYLYHYVLSVVIGLTLFLSLYIYIF